MEELINEYKRRLKTAQNLLEEMTGLNDKEARIRIVAEVNCYSYFIVELEFIKDKNSGKCNENRLDLYGDLKRKGIVCMPEFLSEEYGSKNSVKTISWDNTIYWAN